MSPNEILAILWKRAWIVVLSFLAVMTSVGAALFILPPRYDASTTVLVDVGQADPVTGLAASPNSARLLQGSMVSLIRSQKVAADVVRRLNLTADPAYRAQYAASEARGRVDIVDWIAADLSRMVTAFFSDGSNLVTITVKSPSPQFSATVANAFAAAFIDAALDLKVSGAQQTAEWFEPQIQRLKAEVEEANNKLLAYKRDARLVIPTGNDSDFAPLQTVTSELNAAKAEVVRIESLLASSEKIGPEDVRLESPLLASLRAQQTTLAADIARMRAEVGTNNPKLNALLTTQRTVQEQIRSESANVKKDLQNRLKSLQQQIEYLEAARIKQYDAMISIQAQREQVDRLTKEVEIRQERYMSALRTSSNARMQSQLSFSNVTRLDPAVPPDSAAFPKKFMAWVAGTGAGLVLGLILAMIAEALDRRVRSVADLEFATGVKPIGAIVKSISRRRSRLSRRLRLSFR